MAYVVRSSFPASPTPVTTDDLTALPTETCLRLLDSASFERALVEAFAVLRQQKVLLTHDTDWTGQRYALMLAVHPTDTDAYYFWRVTAEDQQAWEQAHSPPSRARLLLAQMALDTHHISGFHGDLTDDEVWWDQPNPGPDDFGGLGLLYLVTRAWLDVRTDEGHTPESAAFLLSLLLPPTASALLPRARARYAHTAQ
jgi:hypothetical protein